jgi:hypothetical protein
VLAAVVVLAACPVGEAATVDPYPLLTLSYDQMTSAFSDGETLQRHGYPISCTEEGWEATLKSDWVDRAVWTSPVVLVRKEGYWRAQHPFDRSEARDDFGMSNFSKSQSSTSFLEFEVNFSVRVNVPVSSFESEMASAALKMAPNFGPTNVSLKNDTGRRWSSIANPWSPIDRGVWLGGSLGRFPLPNGDSQELRAAFVTATYYVIFCVHTDDGPTITAATKSLTVEFPDFGQQVTFLVPHEFQWTIESRADDSRWFGGQSSQPNAGLPTSPPTAAEANAEASLPVRHAAITSADTPITKRMNEALRRPELARLGIHIWQPDARIPAVLVSFVSDPKPSELNAAVRLLIEEGQKALHSGELSIIADVRGRRVLQGRYSMISKKVVLTELP